MIGYIKKLLVMICVVILSHCVVTPLPLPPSFKEPQVDTAKIAIIQSGPNKIKITGYESSIKPGNISLKIRNYNLKVERVFNVNNDESFTVNIEGNSEDKFVLAFYEDGTKYWVGFFELTAYDNVSLETTNVDQDQDGYDYHIDCDDTNPNINPGANDWCNGIDDDCDLIKDFGCIVCENSTDCIVDLSEATVTWECIDNLCQPVEDIDTCIIGCPVGCSEYPSGWICGSNGNLYCNECILSCYGFETAPYEFCVRKN